MAEYSVRPSTLQDFMLFYGKLPEQTCRAWTVIYDNDIAAIGGVTISRKGLVLFSDMNTEQDYPKMAIFKVASYIVDQVAKMDKPVWAVSTTENQRFLEALGFIYNGNYQGQRLYKLWQPSQQH